MKRPPSREKSYVAQYMREYRARYPKKVKRSNENSKHYMMLRRQFDKSFKTKQAIASAKWHAKLKDDVFRAYGGWACNCCGETEPVFLQLDHVNGNGCHERRLLTGKNIGGNNHVVYNSLRRRGFPPGYQILCANCNVGKHRNGGVCPHKKIRLVEHS